MMGSSQNSKYLSVEVKSIIWVILLISIEEKQFYVIEISHAFMPSECGMLLYNALASIETIAALWGTDLVFEIQLRNCLVSCN